MSKQKRHMSRTIAVVSCLLVVVLCIIFAFQANILFTASLYNDREARLASAITYVEHNVDADDLLECVKTGKPSQEYQKLQRLMNMLVDDFSLAYLYLTIPLDDENGTMVNVVSATSKAERAMGATDLPLLYVDPLYYYVEQIKPYVEAMEKPGAISYFEEVSESGACYTAAKPIIASNGEKVGILCADLFMEDLYAAKNLYLFTSIGITIIVCLFFTIIMLVLLQRQVVKPLTVLEKRTREFVDIPREKKSIDDMRLDVTDIKPGNEIESLAGSISMMVDDMRQFMRDNLAATQRVADVEHVMQDMSRIVYLDALTGAKSKAAYNQHAGRLNRQIAEGTAEFAILMVDLNNLKGINDSYGHEHGDVFIKGSSKLILMVFAHSPVYRVGGDEFVVVLEDIDYEWREQLMQDLKNRFEKSQDPKRKPWEHYSAAFGLAVYDSTVDPYLDSVYNRADQLMYEDKRAKGGRGR